MFSSESDYDFDDPSDVNPLLISAGHRSFGGADEDTSLETLLKNQIIIAGELQKVIKKEGAGLSTKELKELVSTSSSIVTAAYKAGESLRALTTYRTFVEVVLEFIRRRSDTLGEDLSEELQKVAREMRAETAVREASRGA